MEVQKKLFETFKCLDSKHLLVERVGEILGISDDAAYRRIRGQTELTFTELEKLCSAFGVSLDGIFKIKSPYRMEPYYYYSQDYFNMQDMDFNMSRDYIRSIQVAAKNTYSEFGFVTNNVILHTRTLYPAIFRFFLFKWMYQRGGRSRIVPFSQAVIPDQLQELHNDYNNWVTKIKYTFIIYQELFLQGIVQDIEYFRDIRLLTPADVSLLKESFGKMLSHMEQLIIDGVFETGNKIDIYVSGLNLDMSYSYLYSDFITISMIDAFTVGAMASIDANTCEDMQKWMQSLKHTSTLLSGCSERTRFRFFEKQRAFLNKL
ncbi:MAG: helix-turn-helix domain-containing protein [Prevotella sp.]|jgi:hypothetical protein|nr:helix-turn-helix domain-containing protein [Prevotella sp.]